MSLDTERTRKLLQSFDFKTLFVEELGWDNYTTLLVVPVDGQEYTLNAIVEKRGMVVFSYETPKNASMPDYPVRRKIERQVAKSHHEHIIIYVNPERTMQLWQWARRETGKPTACREHRFYSTQPGDSLIQKINILAFNLEEEEKLTITDVGRRARKAFDVEKVTKRFYDRFKTEHEKFLKFLRGIPDEKIQRWYVSVMLNRLMFIYFIQKKGFLDNDTNYLRSRLRKSKEYGSDLYYTNFLCPLFFEGFAKKENDRTPETNQLLGTVPYLDGGLFQRHQIENLHGKQIQIEDAAFENLFAFFDEYDWHLDERPRHADNEINPDVLGYIFEKYINQKQMGAYYTKEDITGYISKSTIIPFLFDHAQKKCKIAFEGEQSVWRLLAENPDRYIYDAVRKGVELTLPDEIAVGIKDVSKRTGWNKPAPEEYALPTEIWREVVARRQRYEEIWNKMIEGEVRSINDLITYNLDIRQFAHDVIENCEGPELLRAIYYTIAGRIPEKSNEQFQPGMSILDPTCGSGAFLFAALNILEPLYEACLDRMQVFLDELESSGQKHRSDKFGDFRKIIKQIEKHPNRRYFILKSIVLNNLYGVDIMEEATEICKLRLFLKLVAQVDNVAKIEPLPDIDFNIRAGNTLVGFANKDEVREAITTSEAGVHKQTALMFGEKVDAMDQIEEKAEFADRAFKNFRQMQTGFGMDAKDFSKDFVDAKQKLGNKLTALGDELDHYLASDYGIDQKNISRESEYQKRFTQWRDSHQPFHWFIEFYCIIKEGGFDVIIGNPPYVEYAKLRDTYVVQGFKTMSGSNLYAFCCEKAFALKNSHSRFGMILPNSSISANKMAPLQEIFCNNRNVSWISNFSWRPSKLFEGADMLLAIVITASNQKCNDTFASSYYKWYSEYRDFLFHNIIFCNISHWLRPGTIPKLLGPIFESILKKLLSKSPRKALQHQFSGKVQKHYLFYFRAVQYWIKILDIEPIFEEDGKHATTGEMKPIYCFSDELRYILVSILSSSTFFAYYITWSSCQVINNRDFDMPFDDQDLLPFHRRALVELGRRLQKDYQNNSQVIERKYSKRGRSFTMRKQHFYIKQSKPIIDEIDCLLAQHYGFTDEELDFIINYDIKYRMGIK